MTTSPCNEPLEVEIYCLNADLPNLSGRLDRGLCRLELTIPSAKLWWPNGLGEAFLYQFEIVLKQGQEIVDTLSRNVGIRTIEVINEPDEQGVSFYFKVNGHPVFMKGANYIPGDSFIHRMDEQRLQQTFEDAVAAKYEYVTCLGRWCLSG